MTQNRVRIVDVADALGLSTATVSKVIHGKTEKISDETVKRVQQELERSEYAIHKFLLSITISFNVMVIPSLEMLFPTTFV